MLCLNVIAVLLQSRSFLVWQAHEERHSRGKRLLVGRAVKCFCSEHIAILQLLCLNGQAVTLPAESSKQLILDSDVIIQTCDVCTCLRYPIWVKWSNLRFCFIIWALGCVVVVYFKWVDCCCWLFFFFFRSEAHSAQHATTNSRVDDHRIIKIGKNLQDHLVQPSPYHQDYLLSQGPYPVPGGILPSWLLLPFFFFCLG